MVLVVFARVLFGDHYVRTDFGVYQLVRQILVGGVLLEILKGHAGLANPFVKLVGIGQAALQLKLRHTAGDLGLYFDVELLGLLHQQPLVDHNFEHVLGLLGDGGIEGGAAKVLLLLNPLTDGALALAEITLQDDVAVYFDGDPPMIFTSAANAAEAMRTTTDQRNIRLTFILAILRPSVVPFFPEETRGLRGRRFGPAVAESARRPG